MNNEIPFANPDDTEPEPEYPSNDKMDPTWKAKWLTALRSGDYTQTTGNLRTEQGHCCLGVLCDIVDPTRWVDAPGNRYRYQYKASTEYDLLVNEFLPEDIGDLVKMPLHGQQSALANMNDAGCTFAYIADYIENNL